jgi:hypothetical protein
MGYGYEITNHRANKRPGREVNKDDSRIIKNKETSIARTPHQYLGKETSWAK